MREPARGNLQREIRLLGFTTLHHSQRYAIPQCLDPSHPDTKARCAAMMTRKASAGNRGGNLQMRAHVLLVLLATADALLLSGNGSSRRAKLRELARLAAGGLAASCGAVVLAGRPRWTSPAWGGGGEELWLYSDDVATAQQLASLQSANDMAPARRRLESDWANLRKRPVSRPEAEAAFATVLRARAAVARAEAAVRAASPRWAEEVEAAISPNLVRELEAAATVRTRSKPEPEPPDPPTTRTPTRARARARSRAQARSRNQALSRRPGAHECLFAHRGRGPRRHRLAVG
jgi:hypothetical protein